ncbi:MAG TPA: addiction module protein [Urbifossiella sp.]|jgi:putative addiction module component (TIGR02574 family)|nr:addiction module protein [Urbifossiella sp.]
MSTKEAVIEMIRGLPEGATWADIVAEGAARFSDADAGEPLSQEEWEAMWVAECERRLADVEAGRTKLIPAEEVMARMRAKFG